MQRRFISGFLLLLSLVGGVACRPAATTTETDERRFASGQERPYVYVVNYPLEFFASRIGGDLVVVTFPAPADLDPAFWKPPAATIAQFQQADLILVNGAGYAKWTQHVSLPDSRVIDTSRAFADKLIQIDDGVVHRHGPAGDHSHQGFAFTTWLDPQLAILQAAEIQRAFGELLPESRSTLEANYQKLKIELEQLDRQFDLLAARYQGQPLLASHPVYQYLARRCGWSLRSLHWEPEEVPAAEEWQALARLRESHPSKWMLWEAPPNRETAEKLAAMGVTSIVFEPCGNRPSVGYFQAMDENIQRLMTVFPDEQSLLPVTGSLQFAHR